MAAIRRISNRDSELLQATVAFPSLSSVVKQLVSLCIDLLRMSLSLTLSFLTSILALRDDSSTISIRIYGSTLSIEVADDGRGIPRNRLENLSTRRKPAQEYFLTA